MNIKQFFIAGLLSGMVMFFIAALWHEWVMAAFYEDEMHASHKGTGIIFLAYLVLGFLMVYFYSRSFQKKKSWTADLWFGILMGILWVFPHELAMAGAHATSIMYVIKNGLWHMTEQGIGGILIGIVYYNRLLVR